MDNKIAAYYAGLVLLLPGVLLALWVYLFHGMLGDIFSSMEKISHLFPSSWGWGWGFAVVALITIACLAVVVFLVCARPLTTYRPYAAAVLFAVAALSLVTMVSDEEMSTAQIALFCFVMSPLSMLATGFVMWKAWGSA